VRELIAARMRSAIREIRVTRDVAVPTLVSALTPVYVSKVLYVRFQESAESVALAHSGSRPRLEVEMRGWRSAPGATRNRPDMLNG